MTDSSARSSKKSNSRGRKPAAASSEDAGDWRETTLDQIRQLIQQADPEAVEEVKWRKPSNSMQGVPVWSHAGILCTGETYKSAVKLTFAKGAALADPQGLFNSSLEGNTRRAIDIREGETLDAKAFKALIRSAVAANLQSGTPKSKAPAKRTQSKSVSKELPTTRSRSGETVVLLSGGNPQIAKADGDAPVQAYIAAMPGWKHDVGKRLDELIVKSVPRVRKAVRWNTPFYGLEGQGWFVAYHCITKYVKVTFFRGTSLDPVPPEPSKQEGVRYFHIHEDDPIDDKLLKSWFKQASQLPGDMCF